ncbi:MAG: hypothetical protein ACRCZZ_06850 [Phocaeicola sp.]
MKLTAKTSGISIPNHRGTWYVVNVRNYPQRPVFMLEHEEYGEDAEHLFVTETGEELCQAYEWSDFEEQTQLELPNELSISAQLYIKQEDLAESLGDELIDPNALAFQIVEKLLAQQYPNSAFHVYEAELQTI